MRGFLDDAAGGACRRGVLALSQVRQRHGGVQLVPVRSAFSLQASFRIAPGMRSLVVMSDVSNTLID